MSALDSLLERLQRAYAKIAEIESVAMKTPGDRYVLANLAALKRDAANLERAWEEECRHAQKEVCRYRLAADDGGAYSVRHFSQSLLGFQELFSQVYDAARTGVLKARAVVSVASAQESSFNFGFAYPGSLGVAMTVDSTVDLFSAKYDETVDGLISIVALNNEEDVRRIAKTYGLAVVRRTYMWSKTNAAASYAVDIDWTTSLGRKKGAHTRASDFVRMVELIDKVSDVERASLSITGTLLGIDAKTRVFRFAQLDGPMFVGRLADGFPSEDEWAINKNYSAEIESEATTKYAAEEPTYSYRLKGLKSE